MQPVTMYTRSWCSYCAAARDLLTTKGIAFEEIEITGRPAEQAEMVQRAAGRTSVPQIFVGERHVGGFTDLLALERQGEFDRLLAA